MFAVKTPGFLKPIAKIFEPLVELLHWALVNLHSGITSLGVKGAAWGLAIIGLTIIVRLILMPLTFKQFRSARAMAALQPHIKELQRKHKGDKARLQQETMRLYRENQVNPFASCLPMLLQIPIFISLYWTIRGTSYLDSATTKALNSSHFLWLTHGLGSPDRTYILLIIYVVSQLVSTELMMSPQTEKQQKMIMRAMPIFFIVILRNFPSGLFLYWVTTNLWTIGQQLIIRHRMPHDVAVANVKVPAAGGAADSKSGAAAAPPKGRFMRALMAAQEERERQSQGQAKPGAGAASKAGTKPGGAKPGGTKPGGGKPSGKRPNKPSKKGPSRPDV